MMQFNLLNWCDDKITYLKDRQISFVDGVPQLPREFLFDKEVKALSTYSHRKDIPDTVKADALLSFYMFDEFLWPRLYKVDDDLNTLKGYGGIVGFDLSPSIGMLRPRQRLSILINAIYSCYCGCNGIKVLPNYRAGDLGTVCMADFFPDNVPFMIGNHGCNRNGFKGYGLYETDIILGKKRPSILYFYGSVSKTDAEYLIRKYGISIITFPDRRNRIRNGSKSFRYLIEDNIIKKDIYYDATIGGESQWA